MNKILVLTLIALLSACGQKTPSTPKSAPVSPSPEIGIVNLDIIANDESEAEVINFGDMNSSSTVTPKRFYIFNKTNANFVVGNLKNLIEAWDNNTSNPNSVSVTNDTCSNKTLRRIPNNPNACYFDVTIAFNVDLDNNTLVVPIRGTDPLTAPTMLLVVDIAESYLTNEALISFSAAFVKSTEVLSFGTLLPGTSATKRLYISNTSTVSSFPAPTFGSLPAGVSAIRNTCTGSVIPKGVCFIDFKYDHQATNLNAQVNFTSAQLTAPRKILNLVATSLQDNVVANAPKLDFFYENYPETTSAGSSYIRRLTVTNLSSLLSYTFGANEVGSLFTDPSLTVLRNTCDGKTLAKDKSCIVDVRHIPVTDSQSVVINVDIPSAKVSEVITIGAPITACTVVNSGIANVAAVSGNTPSCTVVSCVANHSNVNNACVPDACVLTDFPFSATLTGNKVAGCVIETCQTNYTVNTVANTCEPALCTPLDLANSATVTGNKITGCLVDTCQATFSKVANTCVSSNVTRACTIQPNNSTQGLETSVDGGVTFGLCTGFICNTNYTVSGQTCIPQSCNVADFPGASVVTGDKVAGCIVQSCTSPLQEVVANSCVDKNPDGSIVFAQSYTNILTPNTINIVSPTNAQQIQFYGDAACSNLAGPALALPLSSTGLTLSSGDGTKNAYAKFINGSASSSCKTASIVLDTLAPALVINQPDSNASVTGTSLALSGTCAELNSPTVEIDISIGSVNSSVNCSGGIFSTSVDISSLSDGAQTISLSATDLAGNTGTTSSNFNKLGCTALQNQVGNTCVDKTPNGTIAFAQAYTKVLNPNVLNISAVVDAQQIQFYSDAACSINAGAPLALPLTSTNRTLAAPDGVKTVYAKFINGTASSACKTASIILDTLAPALAFVNPAPSANIAGSLYTVSGTCSELNSPTVQVSITLNGVTQNVNCASGNFSSQFSISSLANGPYTISASATDLATNTGTASVSFNKTTCSTFQTLSVNTCVDNNPTGSISFAQSSTKVQTGNTLNITSTNSQQMQLYTNNTCATTLGSVVNLPAASTLVDLTANQGTKLVYAKFINGTKSLCVTTPATIIFDQTSPTIVLNSPTVNQSVSTTTIPVSGTCADSLSGMRSAGITISISGVSGSQTVSCSNSTSGNFSVNYPTTGLVIGTNYTLNISANDNALNNTLVTRNFIRSSFCTPNAAQSCVITNGTGSQTCNAGGTAYGSCTVASCNSGYTQSGNACLQNLTLSFNTQTSILNGSNTIQTNIPLTVIPNKSTIKMRVLVGGNPIAINEDIVDKDISSIRSIYVDISSYTTMNATIEVTDVDNQISTIGFSVTNFSSGWSQVGAGQDFSCGIRTSDNQVYCWGSNLFGQSGSGNNSLKINPVKAITNNVGASFGAVSRLSVGAAHACVVKTSDSKVYCWGLNSDGQLGLGSGDTANYSYPVPVISTTLGTGVLGLSAGGSHTCAIKSNGVLYCWGYNFYGQIGDGTVGGIRNVPTAVVATTLGAVNQVSTGPNNTCARKTSDNKAYCWGDNQWGQVGNGASGTDLKQLTPAAVNSTNLTAISSISSGYPRTCASRLSDNKVYCWGENSSGHLGTGAMTVLETTPAAVNLTNLGNTSVINSAVYYSCARKVTGNTLHCWGDNSYGQLGLNTSFPSIPNIVSNSLGQISSLSSTYFHVCAIDTNSKIYCWGQNQNGQLGDANTFDRTPPP